MNFDQWWSAVGYSVRYSYSFRSLILFIKKNKLIPFLPEVNAIDEEGRKKLRINYSLHSAINWIINSINEAEPTPERNWLRINEWRHCGTPRWVKCKINEWIDGINEWICFNETKKAVVAAAVAFTSLHHLIPFTSLHSILSIKFLFARSLPAALVSL